MSQTSSQPSVVDVGSMASSRVVRMALETPGLRVLGRMLFPVYTAVLPTGDRLRLRSKFDWDLSTVTEVYLRGIYEKRFRIEEGDGVVDVGAHIGSFTLKAAHEVGPSGSVVSVEPYSANYKLLRTNVAINTYKNILTLNEGLGSAPGEAKLNVSARGGGNSIYDRGEKSRVSERVVINTLDSLSAKFMPSGVDFIKIDVEGFELEVLKGATGVLAGDKPKIAMETHEWGPSTRELTAFLEVYGYKVTVEPYHSQLGLLYAV